MIWRSAVVALLAATVAHGAPTDKRNNNFSWGKEKIRGVNLGGWLVLEPWITPSIFDNLYAQYKDPEIKDEYSICKKLGADRAVKEVLQKHWDTWVQPEDFKKIADAGLNLVRLPVGFWAYDTFDTPYAQGAAPYVDKAIEWARAVGLKVLIDLHGAPRSQNGFDNSGQLTDSPEWLKDESGEQTVSVIETISQKYAKKEYQDVVVGIQLINEPLMEKLGNDDGVKWYYRQGYEKVRDVSDTTVVLHDGFKPAKTWNGFLSASDNGAKNVAVDHHEYQVFDNNMVGWPAWSHRQHVCNNVNSYAANADHWTFVGEWTGAMTDCARYLNGFKKGARYDGTFENSTYHGSCDKYNDLGKWEQYYKDDTRGYIEAQMEAFEAKTQGWVWWNFKTEGAAEWDLFQLLDAQIFPSPVTDRKFSMICSNL